MNDIHVSLSTSIDMTSFRWKRKIGEKFSKSQAKAFEEDAAKDEDPEIQDGEIDWLSLTTINSKKRIISLEDANAKSERLREEGAILAQSDRWE